MIRVEGGDCSALEEIYSRHSPRVFGIARGSISNQESAEEVVQDVFVSVWKNSGSYDPQKSTFVTWLITITRNRCIDELRKINRRVRRETPENHEYLNASGQNSTESEAVSSIEAERAKRLLVNLPKEQRKVIELAYFQGLTGREISELLEIPPGTVKTRMRSGLQKLRRAYEEGDIAQIRTGA